VTCTERQSPLVDAPAARQKYSSASRCLSLTVERPTLQLHPTAPISLHPKGLLPFAELPCHSSLRNSPPLLRLSFLCRLYRFYLANLPRVLLRPAINLPYNRPASSSLSQPRAACPESQRAISAPDQTEYPLPAVQGTGAPVELQ
jgi:hypothetical protein